MGATLHKKEKHQHFVTVKQNKLLNSILLHNIYLGGAATCVVSSSSRSSSISGICNTKQSVILNKVITVYLEQLSDPLQNNDQKYNCCSFVVT